MNTSALPLALLSVFALATTSVRAADDVKLTRLNDRVRVELNGQLFTEYLFSGYTRPSCYPILAPDGTSLTRDFPFKQNTGEDTDHPWHKALFFEHSMMNGVDFWNEAGGDVARSGNKKGNTVNDGEVKITSGPVGTLQSHNRYVAPDGKLICTDERTLRFGTLGDGRYIDYEVTLHALPDEPLKLGDNKDGTMAIRIPQWMTMPHKVKGVETGGKGHIVTANGDRDKDAWGKRADWCDYHAEHNGKTYGIAIFDHPQNLRHPTWWMARDYGLFGANPFGWHDYEPKTTQPHAGDLTLPPGGKLTLKYRFYFHPGEEQQAGIAERYAEYAAGK